jgi:hypothetical protein
MAALERSVTIRRRVGIAPREIPVDPLHHHHRRVVREAPPLPADQPGDPDPVHVPWLRKRNKKNKK